jgi:hypothetical protein
MAERVKADCGADLVEHSYAFGKAPFRGMKVETRVAPLQRLAPILADNEPIERGYAAIEVTLRPYWNED